MIVGIISKDEHCKTHAKGLTEDGHTVVLLGAGGERIPDHLDVMVCRIGSCSHRGSTVAREWKRKTGRPLIVEDGLAGIRRQLQFIAEEEQARAAGAASKETTVQISSPLRVYTLDEIDTTIRTLVPAQPAPIATPEPPPPEPLPPEEQVKPEPVLLPTPQPPPPPRHISRGPYADWTRAKRVAVLTEIFRENPGMDGVNAWKLHEIQTAPRASVDREMIAEARRAARGEIARVNTIPTENPREVLAATPANAQPTKAAPTDVRDLVQLLRVAMEAEGIERLTVTKDTVSFRRVVVEEGTFDV